MKPSKFWIALLGLCFLCQFQAKGYTDQILKRLDAPLPLQVSDTLDTGTTQPGQAFSATLADNVWYHNQMLPKGTVFKGNVETVQPPRVFGRPGYFVMNLREVVYPTGEVQPLSLVPGMGEDSMKVNRNGARNIGFFLTRMVPLGIASTAASIPLGVASGLNGGVFYAITTGTRMATGAAVGATTDIFGTGTVAQRSTNGAWWGTGVPGTMEFFTKDKHEHYAAGDILPLRINADVMQRVFNSAELVQTGFPGFQETTGPVSPPTVQPAVPGNP